MSGRRGMLLTALAVPLALAGLVAGYVKLELIERERFAERAVEALRSPEVRSAIAEQVTVEMIERGSPELIASRPLVLGAVEAVLETDEFSRILDRAARAAHDVLLRGDEDVIVELRRAEEVLLPAVESVAPELAEQIPRDLSPSIAEIRSSDAAAWTLRVAEGASALALPLLLTAALALLGGVAIAPDRGRALVAAGLALAAAAALGIGAMAAMRAQVVLRSEALGLLSDDAARAAAGAAWDALAGGLEQWLVIMGVGGLALTVGTLLAEARVDRAAALGHAARMIAGGRLSGPLQLLRGLALAAIGALILLRAEPLLTVALAGLGGALLLLGLAEAIATVAPRRGARPGPRFGGRRWAIGLGAAGLAAIGVTAVLLIRAGPPAPPPSEEITACNGLAELCDRRLDEVVFAGTHNSMAAADRPGWFFANQIHPIPRQLEDGIRLLMIDPHYGVVDSQGRVRTDLAAEGTSRNRVAGRVGAEAVAVAERLGGRLGLTPTAGEREIFLCHSLCELGAERMRSTLDEVRGFLERNPAEVLIVFLESSVDPDDVERELERSGLEPFLATLDRRQPRTLPTMREMVASGRRLIVLDQGDGGDAEWHHPGFLFVQDTRIKSLLGSPTACDPNRGSPESPLFLLNHWIDRFPPPLGENRTVGSRDAILRRIEACRTDRGRAPNLIAVDFYDRSEVLATVRALNQEGGAR